MSMTSGKQGSCHVTTLSARNESEGKNDIGIQLVFIAIVLYMFASLTDVYQIAYLMYRDVVVLLQSRRGVSGGLVVSIPGRRGGPPLCWSPQSLILEYIIAHAVVCCHLLLKINENSSILITMFCKWAYTEPNFLYIAGNVITLCYNVRSERCYTIGFIVIS